MWPNTHPPYAIRPILKTGLHLTQEFVHNYHKRLQTNIWIVDLSTTYRVLQLGEMPSLAMQYVFDAVLKSLQEHHPFNDTRRQMTDEERWHICKIIAADWTISTLAFTSNQPFGT